VRDKRILQAARDEPCQWCFRQDGSTVAAHSNQLKHGKGRGIKAPDRFVAFLCFSCHSDLDQGRWMTKEQRRLMWDTAHERTKQILVEKGLIETDDSSAGQAGP
jgi:hypothetical protein